MGKATRRLLRAGHQTGGSARPTTGLASIYDSFTGGFDSSKYLTMQGAVVSDQLVLDAGERFDSISVIPTNYTSAWIKFSNTGTTGQNAVYRVYFANFANHAEFLFRPNSQLVTLKESNGGVDVGTPFNMPFSDFPNLEAYFKIENDGDEWVWYANPGGVGSGPAPGAWTERKRQAFVTAPDTATANSNVTINASGATTGLIVDNLGVYY